MQPLDSKDIPEISGGERPTPGQVVEIDPLPPYTDYPRSPLGPIDPVIEPPPVRT
jgi:hypothetical protein